MPKLTKSANRYGLTDGLTDPNHRKASLLKIIVITWKNLYAFIFSFLLKLYFLLLAFAILWL